MKHSLLFVFKLILVVELHAWLLWVAISCFNCSWQCVNVRSFYLDTMVWKQCYAVEMKWSHLLANRMNCSTVCRWQVSRIYSKGNRGSSSILQQRLQSTYHHQAVARRRTSFTVAGWVPCSCSCLSLGLSDILPLAQKFATAHHCLYAVAANSLPWVAVL